MEIDDPALAKYKDQIEKDLANLDEVIIRDHCMPAHRDRRYRVRPRRAGRRTCRSPNPYRPSQHLDERKAAIYENLRDLQFEYRVGKLSDEDYQQTKKDLQKELAGVLAEVDRIKRELWRTPAPGRGRRPQPRPKAQPADVTSAPHCNASSTRT